ncbi:MAG TPA: hypothetical protein PKD83_03980, partial [Ignavibacteria bacterium]|nr:hypothetical protein [Ignavibacteria bacterium]
MKTTLSYIVTTFALIFILCNSLTGQEVILKTQNGEKKFKAGNNFISSNDVSISKKITQKSESGIRQNSNGWKL